MKDKDVALAKSILGDDIFDVLEKFEIFKPSTKTVVDPEEIKVALQIVPRSVLSYLFANLKHRSIGEPVSLELPFAPARLEINKQGPDNYKGEVISLEGKIVAEFQHRSLPSIGLILLTAFELYDLSLLDEIKKDGEKDTGKVDKLQDIIDERLALHSLVSDVVDRRISQREAIARMIKEKLHDHIASSQEKDEPMETQGKKSKLKEFLESREQRRQQALELDKSEIKCPDCDNSLYKGGESINLCVCYGEHMGKEIKIKKAEQGRVRLKFPKSFDIDNVEMLLDALKGK